MLTAMKNNLTYCRVSKWKKILILFCLFNLLLLLLIYPDTNIIVWTGGFLLVEYNIQFVDCENVPLRNVKVIVENDKGFVSYYYPVSDYSPDRDLLGGDNGIIIFHHVKKGVEFSGAYGYKYWVVPYERGSIPKFHCRFFQNEIEIYSILYDSLEKEYTNHYSNIKFFENLPKVKRMWKWEKAWPENFPEHLLPLDIHEKEIDFPIFKKIVVIK